MIKIQKNDTIVDIINKINSHKEKEIILQFPFGHPLLHNYLSLKIIKSKAGSRKIIIISNDLSAKNIGKKLGIKYSIINDAQFLKDENILTHNFSLLEYTQYLLKKYYQDFKDFLFFNKKLNSLKKYSHNNQKGRSQISLFLLALLISIAVFIFIFYFAVNKTYIHITPEINIKTKTRNLTFSHNE